MAIRSLLLSLAVSVLLGYSFTVGLTNSHSFLKKLPDALSLPLFLGCGFLYVLAAWWALKGFSDHKFTALVSLGFCALGLGVYAVGFSMEAGRGKAAAGQYDYDFSSLEPTEKVVVAQIAHAAGLGFQDAVFTEHWHLADSTSSFRICVQKGHVTALNLSNHPIRNLTFFSQLPNLSDLLLKNCGLSDLSDLKSAKLDRLDVSDNQIADLRTLRGCPNVRWLFASNNHLKSTEGLEQFSQLISKDLTGNPLP
ncbi:hypothetical protein GCM10028803_36830 [Larkinella knui]|uniref:Leucine-rich repeat domain-containing protein n=1 Tax=Larkinella knui TaxID=2025310 RepID=A0A3P1CE61_9BACT|nr:leucine-rich repeat domain-containing protein [Larkinella knui]RRB11538.1 leucine-rich repeat domain-containing protein [Larkinella knui]